MRRWARRMVACTAGVLLLAVVLDRVFPLPLPDPTTGSTVVLARDGTPLRAFPDESGLWRYPVTPEDVSPLYLDALLTYEDRWFHHHPGVNPGSMLRAVGQAIWHRRTISGGSTLSMQVARILEPHSRTPWGKVHQMLRALQLEAHLDKRQILGLYLTYAPFGGTIQGVEAASWAYLGKSARHLSHAEAALLAVLPQSPSRLRPDRHAARAQVARDKVLRRMATLGRWSEAVTRDAMLENVAARALEPPMQAALLAERLAQAAPQRRVIATTIDRELQAAMETRVSTYLGRLPERTSAAVLVVDNSTLETLAYVGSGAFGDPTRLGHVDMIQAVRSPGSTLKPFLYALAIEDGLIHSESLLIDAPQAFGDYRPGNFDLAFNGPVAAADALRLSLNVPAVDLLDRVGPSRFAARLSHAGANLQFPRGADPNLALILGGTGTRLEDLVGAYAAFNRRGLAGAVRYTIDTPLVERRLMDEGAAWIVRDILEANGQPGVQRETFDPGRRARMAWKTGTSFGYRDAWAIGSTRAYTVGVWIGRPDGTPMPGQYGAITALPLLLQANDSLPRRAADATPPVPPPNVAQVDICWPLGLPLDPARPQLCHKKRTAWILDGATPPTLPERDAAQWSSPLLNVRVDARTNQRLTGDCRAPRETLRAIARWPALAQPWLDADLRRRSSLPPRRAGCVDDGLEQTLSLRIDGVRDGATLMRAPGSATAPRLALRALGVQGRVRWLVDGRLAADLDSAKPFEHEYTASGEHTVTALAAGGSYARVDFLVSQ
ncbi:penicillin-binding protein 1C [Tahibacter amnicola]|uniref:peptidoglycan glycosyltransferase n=1 Tax=Tahibacter amnicola TaxID=2976241 RepID=A0ABY6BLG1_9GAMM|nr:penicillin-binding protein 1C [Tahibacter amnicola]UXI70724.1 penicillin-binding protein 1C [Tahibacter amnicola]